MWIYKELEKRLCRCLYILFLTAASFADFCIFYVPPPSLGVTLDALKQRHLRWLSATYICRFYILHRKVDSAWASDFLRLYKGTKKIIISKSFFHKISLHTYIFFVTQYISIIYTMYAAYTKFFIPTLPAFHGIAIACRRNSYHNILIFSTYNGY